MARKTQNEGEFKRPTTTTGSSRPADRQPQGKAQDQKQDKTDSAETTERPKGRIDHPEGKQQYMDKPSGRIDHPEGKQQYMDKPSGRIDHPEGKQQYLDKEDEEPRTSRIDQPGRPVEYDPVPEITDPSTTTYEYRLTLKSLGRVGNDVIKKTLGEKYSTRDVPITVSYNTRTKANAFDNARTLVKLGAKVEIRKIITIEYQIY